MAEVYGQLLPCFPSGVVYITCDLEKGQKSGEVTKNGGQGYVV